MEYGPQNILLVMYQNLFHSGQEYKTMNNVWTISIRNLNRRICYKDSMPKGKTFTVVNPKV